MASKAKEKEAPERDDEDAEAPAEAQAPVKKGLVGRILGFTAFLNPLKILKLPRKMQIMAGGGVLALVLIGVGATMFLGGAPAEDAKDDGHGAEAAHGAPNLPTKHAEFFDVPDIIVNIQTADGSQAYLKLSVALEIEGAETKKKIEPILPRVIDQFQTYLRELRVDDIRGSAGVMRLKEELLRRVNLSVAPIPVHDVLLKEMIVQ
jgi:flagellar FliL protein